jgi:tetratricopeptide (TPR) repeat protein
MLGGKIEKGDLAAMKKSLQMLTLAAISVAVLSTTSCDKLKARSELNKGVQAFKSNKPEQAVDHFQKATELDPSLINARIYLATAYATQYTPGADTPENNQLGQQAIEQYEKVLQQDPKNVNSLKGIASLYYNMKKLDDAKQFHHKVTDVDPNDPETYYSIGVIDWTQAYQAAAETKGKEGLKVDDDIIKDKKLCPALKSQNEPLIQDGIDSLNKALALRPDYDDAMAYLNLLYRRKGDLECGDAAAKQADTKTADDWVDKAMATKKARAEKQPGATGITLEKQEQQ